MTSDEFRFWLTQIHWTLPQLAEILECDISYVEALDRGDIEAPVAYRRKKWKPK